MIISHFCIWKTPPYLFLTKPNLSINTASSIEWAIVLPAPIGAWRSCVPLKRSWLAEVVLNFPVLFMLHKGVKQKAYRENFMQLKKILSDEDCQIRLTSYCQMMLQNDHADVFTWTWTNLKFGFDYMLMFLCKIWNRFHHLHLSCYIFLCHGYCW